MLNEQFEIERNCGYENSFGAVGERDTVTLTVRVNVNDDREYGSFEFYSPCGRYYAEGGLWFNSSRRDLDCVVLELVDYDGVYALPDFILSTLDEAGYDVEEMVRCHRQ